MPITLTTVNDLKIAIAGYMQREPSVFIRTVGNNTFDLLLLACNNARLYAERLVDFELSRQDCKVTVSRDEGGSLAFATEIEDENTGVSIKKIVSPFVLHADGNTYPVELWSRKKWDDRVRRKALNVRPDDTTNSTNWWFAGSPFVIVQEGRTVYVAPVDVGMFPSEEFDLYFNVVSWLPKYATGDEDDFLLENCFDWMLFYSISQLNFYLKEDERVVLSDNVLKDTWNSVVKWNFELTDSSTDNANLD